MLIPIQFMFVNYVLNRTKSSVVTQRTFCYRSNASFLAVFIILPLRQLKSLRWMTRNRIRSSHMYHQQRSMLTSCHLFGPWRIWIRTVPLPVTEDRHIDMTIIGSRSTFKYHNFSERPSLDVASVTAIKCSHGSKFGKILDEIRDLFGDTANPWQQSLECIFDRSRRHHDPIFRHCQQGSRFGPSLIN